MICWCGLKEVEMAGEASLYLETCIKNKTIDKSLETQNLMF